MNKVFMVGRLTKAPEIRYGGQARQTCVAGFSLAVDRRFKRDGDPEADFFNCSAFGKTGEFVERYLHKGSKILLSGRVENNNYTDRNGQKVYAIRIVAEELEFAESKPETQPVPPQAYSQPVPPIRAQYEQVSFVPQPQAYSQPTAPAPQYEQQSFVTQQGTDNPWLVPDNVDDGELPFN